MHAIGLKCARCDWQGAPNLLYECPNCGYSLDVFYNYQEVNRQSVEEAIEHFRDMWDFAELLPIRQRKHIISMKEGGTPLISSKLQLGCQAYWKDETRNPTLSFKDRPNTVGISVAREFGCTDVSIASTGNGGASLAAYAVQAGMKCHVCIPESTPQGKVVQQIYHNADMILCRGDYGDSFKRNKALSEKNHWANMTSTYLNPYTVEGDKTIAYEIFSQLGRIVPDWILVPLGAGAMLTGILKGFEELRILGIADRVPRMMGVQATGCSPIIDAWIDGNDNVLAWGECKTIAGAIADPLTGYEKDGDRTLASIRKSKGCGIKVRDEEIVEGLKELATVDALFVEPASATVVAAIKQAVKEDVIKPQDIVVGIVTAHGLKDVDELAQIAEEGFCKNETSE